MRSIRLPDVTFIVHAAFALQIPFYVMNVLLLRVVAALRANHLIFQGAAVNLAVKVIANLVFMHYWGVVCIAAATTLVYLASFAFLYWRIRAISAQRAAR